jgi:hypothetical protein
LGRPLWIQENLEEAFWRFVDQNWRDWLNMEAAEPQNMDYRQETRKGISEGAKKPNQDRPRKAPEAKVALASAEAV